MAGRTLGIVQEDLNATNELADDYLRFVRDQQVLCIDMREPLRAYEQPAYWFIDHHLKLLGHQLVAETIFPVIEAMVESESNQHGSELLSAR